MRRRLDHLLVLSTTLVLVFIGLTCQAQTIRSQRGLKSLEGMTGVITNIGGTRVTISVEETGETLTLHVRDASDLRIGDFVKMEAGRPVKTDPPVKSDTPSLPPGQADVPKAEEPPSAAQAPKPQPEALESAKPSPNAQK